MAQFSIRSRVISWRIGLRTYLASLVFISMMGGSWADDQAAQDGSLEKNNRRAWMADHQAVEEILKRGDWSAAMKQVAILNHRHVEGEEKFSWKSKLKDNIEWQVELQRLESLRDLLEPIAKAIPANDQDAAARFISLRIELDQRLVRHLDPPRTRYFGGWATALAEIKWWWDEVPEAREVFESDDRYSRYDWDVPLFLGRDGRPVFLDPPATYEKGLPRSKKLLFVLNEIETLDNSPKRDAAAAALLAKAHLMRRLYGPQTDVDWHSIEFCYRYNKRPSFIKARPSQDIKETWQLADNEARTNVQQVSQVIELPEGQSPLALLASLERDYPNSDSVPAAIHERGLYYQSRLQFDKALDAYRRQIREFPDHPLTKEAKEQIARIEHADVILGKTGVYASGVSPRLWFACRNAERVEFTARRFDLEQWIKDAKWGKIGHLMSGWELFHRSFESSENEQLKQLDECTGEEAHRWIQAVERSDRVASHATAAPLMEAGVYRIEAHIPGSQQSSTSLLVITGIEIVQKPLVGAVLLWVVDSRTGQPLANQKVQIVERDRTGDRVERDWTAISDERGIIECRGDKNDFWHISGDYLFASAEGRGITFCEMAPKLDRSDGQREAHYLLLTDRPVYRPGSNVNFRLWVREMSDRVYLEPTAGQKVQIEVYSPNHDAIRSLSLETDATGSVTGSFMTGPEAPLGEYHVTSVLPGAHFASGAGSFRIEQYKTPEFNVTVSPTKKLARPGEAVSVSVAAQYYFGAPVKGAEVNYKVYRSRQANAYALPGEFDWLYGRGYGAALAKAPPGDDDDPGARFRSDRHYWEEDHQELRERVDEGSAQLNAEGQVQIRFDPAALKSAATQDWRYDFEVEVRDEGRRTVDATGSVVAARQEFQAFAQMNRGWYSPCESVVIKLQARSANDLPVAASGEAVVKRLRNSEKDAPPADEVRRWDVALDAEGNHQLELAAPSSGQYQFEFRTRDSLGTDVAAVSNFWVYEPNADLSRCVLPSLQIIADKPTYRIGDLARLLVVTAAEQTAVLIDDNSRPYCFLSVSKHAAILEISIDDKSVPDRIIEGTVVWEGAMSSKTCKLFVPPVRDLLNIDLIAEKKAYRPGEQGKLRLKVTDWEGRPAPGDLALTAFDKAVTYIQPESAIGPKSFIAARKSSAEDWNDGTLSTLNPRKFDSSGSFLCPEFYLSDDYRPTTGMMGGGAPTGGDPGDTDRAANREQDQNDPDQRPEHEPVMPQIRSNFSNTAIWRPHVIVDANGVAETDITFPESLTTWRFRGYLVTPQTRVGDLAADLTTSKSLLVRLQRPRFLVEQDKVVLSANVHNDLPREKSVTAELLVPQAIFRTADADAVGLALDAEGNLRLTSRAQIPAGGTHRFDWKLAVVNDGLATVAVKALTDEESDAMRTSIPVRTQSTLDTTTRTGAFIAGESGKKPLTFEIPDDADPRKTRVTVTLVPSPASAAFEAIPYLVGYPYGCVEQTMSRFYPTVLAAKALQDLKIDIGQLVAKPDSQKKSHHSASSTTFVNREEIEQMTEAGLQRLQRFQHADGGWGWWEHDQSLPYMTAYVLIGLHLAAENGAKVNQHSFDNGLRYLANVQKRGTSAVSNHSRAQVHHTAVMSTYALSLRRPASFQPQEHERYAETQSVLTAQLDSAFEGRRQATVYDNLLLALSLHNQRIDDRAALVLKEVLQNVRQDDTQGTAFVPITAPEHWHAWNREIETNAWLLRTVVAIDRDNPVTAKIVNWLALNRKYGRFWQSTRETALAVTAISEYLVASNNSGGDQQIEFRLDDGPTTRVRLSRNDILGVNLTLHAPSDGPLAPGRHEWILEKSEAGPLNFTLHAEFQRPPSSVEGRGQGMSITRKYVRSNVASNVGNDPDIDAKRSSRATADRRVLMNEDTLAIGDVIEVELTINADQDYDYVAFEDMKPAGCEPVQIQSGQTYGDGIWANVELRDDRIAFFATHLSKGKHTLRYKLRAETPGKFHALPARGFAMYAPEIQARSNASTILIRDDK